MSIQEKLKDTKLVTYGKSKERECLAKQVMGLSCVPAEGALIVLDDQDYDGDTDAFLDCGFRGPAFCTKMTIEFAAFNAPRSVSDALLDEQRQVNPEGYRDLVWLSKSACFNPRLDEGTERQRVSFCWVFAHELRHLKQFETPETRSLQEVSHALQDWVKGNSEKFQCLSQMNIPTELDAELAAWRLARHIFSEQAAHEYIEWKVQTSEMDHKRIFSCLKHKDPDKPPSDLVAETTAQLDLWVREQGFAKSHSELLKLRRRLVAS